MIAMIQSLHNEVICFMIYVNVVKSGIISYLGHANYYAHLHGHVACSTHMLVRQISLDSGELAGKSFGTRIINSYWKKNVMTKKEVVVSLSLIEGSTVYTGRKILDLVSD